MPLYQCETNNENCFATGAPRVEAFESLWPTGIIKIAQRSTLKKFNEKFHTVFTHLLHNRTIKNRNNGFGTIGNEIGARVTVFNYFVMENYFSPA